MSIKKKLGITAYIGEIFKSVPIIETKKKESDFENEKKSKIMVKYSPTDFFEGCRMKTSSFSKAVE